MPSRQQLYQAKATECERQAAHAKEPSIRTGYLELARSWRELAEQAALIEQRTTPNPAEVSSWALG